MALARRQIVTVVVAVCALVLALGLIIARGPTGQRGRVLETVYYYDIGTGDLFSGDGSLAPPINAPSGSEAVRAYVFACGDCADEASRFIAWISRFSDAAKEELAKPLNKRDPIIIEEGSLVSTPSTNPTWLLAESTRGYAVRDAPGNKCDNAVQCQP